jgi:5-methylthioadenosine/S-adenosylhomocysteine deaminase
MAEIVIHDATILTVDDRNRLYERGTVVVEDGRISDVRRTRDGDADGSADRVVDGAGTVVMPGLVSTRTSN